MPVSAPRQKLRPHGAEPGADPRGSGAAWRETFLRRVGARHRDFSDIAAMHVEPRPGLEVLDVGCGSGILGWPAIHCSSMVATISVWISRRKTSLFAARHYPTETHDFMHFEVGNAAYAPNQPSRQNSLASRYESFRSSDGAFRLDSLKREGCAVLPSRGGPIVKARWHSDHELFRPRRALSGNSRRPQAGFCQPLPRKSQTRWIFDKWCRGRRTGFVRVDGGSRVGGSDQRNGARRRTHRRRRPHVENALLPGQLEGSYPASTSRTCSCSETWRRGPARRITKAREVFLIERQQLRADLSPRKLRASTAPPLLGLTWPSWRRTPARLSRTREILRESLKLPDKIDARVSR